MAHESPRVIAWEVTHQCRLDCRHCRARATTSPAADELTGEEGKSFLDDLADMGKPIVIMTGGDPLMRSDIFPLIAHARGLGLPVALASCGSGMTAQTARHLRSAGISRISLSLDGASKDTHDLFRGVEGSYDEVMIAAATARNAGLLFQFNTVVHNGNLDELPDIFAAVNNEKAVGWDVFLLVPTGRARDWAGRELSLSAYDRALEWIAKTAADNDMPIKVTCAPQYIHAAKKYGVRATPCLGGKKFAFISHRGEVQPCGFLDISAGSLRQEKFSRIWQESGLFADLRMPEKLKGKCGSCAFNRACGGCRARAYATHNDYLGAEPLCSHNPEAGANG